ncbi:MAG TPA: SLC13 family permease [Thermoleophilaceae bacterium]|nr:SLC13 family permease [Thermoleophilaceae bacterium]
MSVSDELISILVLIVVFLIATTMGVNMGVLGIVAAFGLGTALGVSEDDIFAGFPGDLFVILVGVTFLFAIASNNGTVDWVIQAAVRAVRGRTAAIPWVFFLVTAVLTASGAVVPGAVAIVAPIGIGFALQYGINPLLMGLMIINGATAGGFSPISVFGSIVNGVVERNDLAENAFLLFISSFVFNLLLSIVVFFLFGGRRLLDHRIEPGEGNPVAEVSDHERAEEEDEKQPATTGEVADLTRDQKLTLLGIVTLIVVALAFEVDVGFVALSIAAVLSLISPGSTKGAVEKIAWPTVLLICYVGGVVSAFASTTGILGALIPLAVPFLETGAVGAVGMIIALSISSSVVDSSPFSTSCALTVANTPAEHRDFVFRRLMQWGMSMVLIAPAIAWLVFVVPDWL